MKIFYLDTSSSLLVTGIVENEKILCQIKKEFGHDLSVETLPQISNMFKENNINPSEIDKIVVVNGPGSFTGIRIGITIAKIYAFTYNIPITTISSLEAMMVSINTNKYIIPIIDARRGYVYAGLYDSNKNNIIEPQHIKYEKLLEQVKNYDYIYVSNDNLKLNNEIKNYDANIEEIVKYIKNKDTINPHLVNPNYLKLTEAEENNANN